MTDRINALTAKTIAPDCEEIVVNQCLFPDARATAQAITMNDIKKMCSICRLNKNLLLLNTVIYL